MAPEEKGDEFWVAERDTYKELADHETDLLNERTNVLLLYNSILIAALAIRNIGQYLSLVVGLSGLISTLIWLYLGYRGSSLGEHAWNNVLESEGKMSLALPHTLTEFVLHRKQTRWSVFGWSISASTYMGIVLPSIWAITWLAVLLALCGSHQLQGRT